MEAKFSKTCSKRIHVKKRVHLCQTQWEHTLSGFEGFLHVPRPDLGKRCLTLFRAGGGGTLCPQVNFLKYLKNALSYRVETFWLFEWTNFQNMHLVFNCLRPPLVTIATPNLDACFRTTYFNSFHAKSPQNSNVFCYIYEEYPKWNLLWRFGLNIRLYGVLVTVFVSHSFSSFIDLKKNTTTTMATPMVSFDSVFHMLSEKVTFFYFYWGAQGFWFLNGDS